MQKSRELYCIKQAYQLPGVLGDASFVAEDLDKLLSLSVAEGHAGDGGQQGLVGQQKGGVGRVHSNHYQRENRIVKYVILLDEK